MSRYSLRPYKSAKADLKDLYKIFLPSKLYVSLRTNPKELWTLEDEHGKPVAVGRVSQAQEDVQNKVLQVSQEFKELFNLNFTDSYMLRKSESPARIAQEITIVEERTDHEMESLESSPENLGYWRCALYMNLLDKLVTSGMHLEHLETGEGTRSFKIKSISSLGVSYGWDQPLEIHTVPKMCAIKLESAASGRSPWKGFEIDRSGIFGLDAQIDRIDQDLQVFSETIWSTNNIVDARILITGRPKTGKTLVMSRISQLPWKRVYTVDDSSIGKTPIPNLSKLAQDALSMEPCLVQIPILDIYLAEGGRVFETALEKMFTILQGRRIAIVAEKKDAKFSEMLTGCFERVVELTAPNESARRNLIVHILHSHDRNSKDTDINATIISQKTPGWSGFDLARLVRRAISYVPQRSAHQNGLKKHQSSGSLSVNVNPDTTVTIKHLDSAREEVAPSVLDDNQSLKHRKVRWADIGGQEETKRTVEELFQWPLRYPEKFKNLGISPGKGLLLYGPPGCSKTMTALALATEAKLNFISVKGPELLTKYVGESEENLRKIFARARQLAPCVIFFDEIDAIGSSGGTNNETGGGGVNLVSTLLNEMDGVHELIGVAILAATNKPWDIDPALLRPGRLDGVVYVGLPDDGARKEIFNIALTAMPHDSSIDMNMDMLVSSTQGCSGAEIVDLCRRAGLLAMREQLALPSIVVELKHFEAALLGLRRDVSKDVVAMYDAFADRAKRV